MKGHPTLRQAAVIARVFRIDPLLVLDETDPFRVAARIAAVSYVVDEEKAAADKAKR